jgi:hypothetical protein
MPVGSLFCGRMKNKKASRKTKFEIQCEEVAEKTGVSFYSPYNDKNMKTNAFEDDECLHIHKRGVHACFTVGGDNYTGKQQNERTRAVLTALGLEKLITERVLTDETEEEDECSYCGRSD